MEFGEKLQWFKMTIISKAWLLLFQWYPCWWQQQHQTNDAQQEKFNTATFTSAQQR